jgi:hypothetical protein
MMNQPPPGYAPPPPPRQGKPWWVWLLAGCAGCVVLLVLGSVILGGIAFTTVKRTFNDVGPVTATSVQQSLGADFPVYPKAELRETETRAVLATFRFLEKMSRKPQGSIFSGAAIYSTPDSHEKVLKYYEAEMEKAGWSKVSTQESGLQTQLQFKKDSGMALVQVQKEPTGTGTQITLMRGGAGLADLNRQHQNSGSPNPPDAP